MYNSTQNLEGCCIRALKMRWLITWMVFKVLKLSIHCDFNHYDGKKKTL